MRGFDNIPQGGGRNNEAKLEELFEMFDVKTAQRAFVSLRFLPSSMLPIRRHWVNIKTKTGTSTIPKMCNAFNPDDPENPLPGRSCPYCKLAHGKPEEGYPARLDEFMLAQVIVRDLQESMTINPAKFTKEEKASGIKSMDSKSSTPVRVFRMPLGVARRLSEMAEHNKGKPIYDAKLGMDVLIKYNPKASPGDMYKLDRGDGERTPITKEEMGYLTFDLDDFESVYDAMGRLDNQKVLAEFKKLQIIGEGEGSEGDEEDEEDMSPSGRGKKAKKARQRDAEEEDFDEDEEEEEEDEPRSKKKAKPAAKKRRFADEEDEEEEDFGDEEEEEEEEDPRPKKKAKKPVAKKSSRYDDEDEEDEDEEEEEEDEPRRPSSKKAKPAPKKKSRFPDDDDEDEEEEEEEDPRPKKKTKPVAKKASRYDDEDEEDEEEEEEDPRPKKKLKPVAKKSSRYEDDEEEEEEEEEDEPRPSAKKKAKPAAKKTSRYDDDDDEEEEEEEEDEPRRPTAKKKVIKRTVRR